MAYSIRCRYAKLHKKCINWNIRIMLHVPLTCCQLTLHRFGYVILPLSQDVFFSLCSNACIYYVLCLSDQVKLPPKNEEGLDHNNLVNNKIKGKTKCRMNSKMTYSKWWYKVSISQWKQRFSRLRKAGWYSEMIQNEVHCTCAKYALTCANPALLISIGYST